MTRSPRLILSALAVTFLLSLSSCASALKQRCEEQDWAAFGREKGESGAVLTSDPYPGQCRNEGIVPNTMAMNSAYKTGLAKFCSPAEFQAAGAKGDTRSSEVCPSGSLKQLQSAYQAGLLKHCSKQGAFARGRSGARNLRVCPAEMQANYDVYFSQGRTAYLKGEIVTRRKRLAAIEVEMKTIRDQEPELRRKLARSQHIEGKKDLSTTESLESIFRDSSTSLQNQLAENEKKLKSLEEEKAKISLEIPNLELEVAQAAVESTELPSGSL